MKNNYVLFINNGFMELDLRGFPCFNLFRIQNYLNMVILMATVNLQIFVKCFFFSKFVLGTFTLAVCSVIKSQVQLLRPRECSLPVPCPWSFSQAGVLSWLPFPPPEDLSDPGIKPCLLCLRHSQVDSWPLCAIWEALKGMNWEVNNRSKM